MENLFRNLKEKANERKRKALVKRAEEIFQIREYRGETWLTYCDRLILPISYLNTELIEVLAFIRTGYVARNMAE